MSSSAGTGLLDSKNIKRSNFESPERHSKNMDDSIDDIDPNINLSS